MKTIVIDLETVPSIHLEPSAWPCKLPAPPVMGKVPGNIKDAAKIAARLEVLTAKHDAAVIGYAAECEAVRAEAYHRGGMHPLQARVLCIGCAFDNEKTCTLYADYYPGCDVESVEADLIYQFQRIVAAERPQKWIAHNASFDLAMLRMRAEKRQMKALMSIMPWKRYDKLIHCTYEHTQQQMRWKGASLAGLCDYFKIPGKPDGFDGSEVYAAWLRGEHERIAEYCAGDVDMCREVARRQGAMVWHEVER